MSVAPPLIPAQLEWRGDVPVSAHYGDVYFSLEGGLTESRHVFLAANQLPQRFSQADAFVIAELGFGTGLNMLAAWQLWQELAPNNARLHFFSVEQHPLLPADLARAHAAWPELAPFAARLQAIYPPSIPGFHTLMLDNRVTLTLCFGEAGAMLAEMQYPVDAWFLDGFSPANNEQMWRTQLLQQVGRLTAAGGTASTFSAAAAVRQGLAEAGFSVERVAGYGRKRHMTIARKAGVNAAPASKPANVTVIGGGIAGVSVARALADRGVQVTLLEERSALAMGGSGTPAAMLFPRLAKQWTAAARADWAALYHLRRCWLPSSASDGLMQIAKNQRGKRDAEGWAALPAQLGMPEAVMRACDAAELSERVGITIKHGGLFIADSQLISMPDLVLKMAEHPFIKIINGVGVESLEKTGDGWLLMTNCGIMNASHVIVACGSTALRLLPFLTLPLVPVRGQLTRLPTSEPLKAQRLPLGYGGYLSPPDASGHHWLGATFDRGDCSSELSAASHAENIGKLGEIMPALNVMDTTTAALSGWVGHRMTSPDRLPLIGAAPSSVDADVSGLYLSLAHGSRGALSGPLGGEILAAAICQLPTPVEQSVLGTYDPARFQARAKRSFLHSSKE